MAKKRPKARRPPQPRPAGSGLQGSSPSPPTAHSATATVAKPRQSEQRAPSPKPKPAPRAPERAARPAARPGLDLSGYLRLPSGVPRPLAGLTAAAWLLVVVLGATGVITSWTFDVFLLLAIGVVAATGLVARQVARTKPALRAARAVVLLVLALVLPVVFDPHAVDVFNLPKDTVLLVGALVLAGLWLVQLLLAGRLPRWRNGLEWLLVGYVAWTILATIASVDPSFSLFGLRGSYDGLWTTMALVVVAFSAAEAFDAVDVPALVGVAVVGAGSLAALYGIDQIHDFKTSGPRWNFVHFVALPFAHNVFSTFGNPNMWAGFIAIFLPGLVVLALSVRHRGAKAALAVLGLVLLAELLQTATRGAWVAVIVSALAFALAFWPELRARWRLALGAVAAVVVAAAILFAAGGDSYLGAKVSALFKAGPASSVAQRFEMWGGALRIAAHHPIFGAGPDTFEYEFLRVLPKSWVAHLGFGYVADGAHDLFFNLLADKGPLAVAIFVAIVVYGFLRFLAAWRNLRRSERAGGADAVQARTKRWWLAALGAGLVAYLTQGVFNIQNVTLAFAWWCLLGLLLRLTLDARVPPTLVPRALFANASDPGPEPDPTPAWSSTRTQVRVGKRVLGARTRQPATLDVARGLGSLVVVAVVVFFAIGADRPWRASHDFWAAAKAAHQYQALAAQPSLAADATRYHRAYVTLANRAESLDPTLAYFPETIGLSSLRASRVATSTSTKASDLTAAVTQLRRAVRELPISPNDRYNLASGLWQLSQVHPSSAEADLSEAKAELRQAIADYPLQTTYRSLLAKVDSAQRAKTG